MLRKVNYKTINNQIVTNDKCEAIKFKKHCRQVFEDNDENQIKELTARLS